VLWAEEGSGGPLVRSASHLEWPAGQVSWPHRLSHLGSSSYQLNMTHVESVISLGQLAPDFLSRHLPVSYYMRLPLVLDII
jgi:hypothetical protein